MNQIEVTKYSYVHPGSGAKAKVLAKTTVKTLAQARKFLDLIADEPRQQERDPFFYGAGFFAGHRTLAGTNGGGFKTRRPLALEELDGDESRGGV
jgi:hypothetical protein